MSELKPSTCCVKGCKETAVAFCIFAGREKGVRFFSGSLCEKHFTKFHDKYVVKAGG